jgi:hypothetical protein
LRLCSAIAACSAKRTRSALAASTAGLVNVWLRPIAGVEGAQAPVLVCSGARVEIAVTACTTGV